MDIHLLVNLTARAWSVELLAHLHAGVPGRQAPLLAATGAGRTAFGQSLTHVQALGLLERNPGHGHPLRPEFRLTETGKCVAAMAHAVVDQAGAAGDLAVLRRRWSLPVLGVTTAPRRYSQVKQRIGAVTDRALSQSLVQLEDCGWLRRDLVAEPRPAHALYRTDGPGIAIGQSVGAHLICAHRP